MRRRNWEDDPARWPDDARWSHIDYPGIAFRVYGWETKPDEDTIWSGIEPQTGRVIAVMVGDDYRHALYPDDFTLLDDLAYCAVCGQIGCSHDGRDRSEDN